MAKRKQPALQGLAGFWKKGAAKKGTPSLPDGTYQGEIVATKLGLTQKKKPQIDWTLKVTSGEFEGKAQHKYDLVHTQENIDWLFGTLETLEVSIPSKMDSDVALKKLLAKTEGLSIEFSVRTQGDFTNVYINELLDGAEGEEESSSWEVGDKVLVDIEGEEYPGEVTSVDDEEEEAEITCEDGDEVTASFSDMTAVADEDEEEEEEEEE